VGDGPRNQEAPRTELSGFSPNVEAIAHYDPDLVVASDDLAGVVDDLTSAEVIAQLTGGVSPLSEREAAIL